MAETQSKTQEKQAGISGEVGGDKIVWDEATQGPVPDDRKDQYKVVNSSKIEPDTGSDG